MRLIAGLPRRRGGSGRSGDAAAGEHSPDRLTAFSDGVMAVIITIMALELRAPAGHDLAALGHRLPHLLVYVLSFVYIGLYWNNHHHLLRATDSIGGAVMWANLHLLFWLSLMPVLTDWVGSDYRYQLPAATYGVVAFMAAVAYWLLVRSIVSFNGPESRVARAIGSDAKGVVSLVFYLAGIGLTFVDPWIAYVLYALVVLIWVVPDRRFSRAT